MDNGYSIWYVAHNVHMNIPCFCGRLQSEYRSVLVVVSMEATQVLFGPTLDQRKGMRFGVIVLLFHILMFRSNVVDYIHKKRL